MPATPAVKEVPPSFIQHWGNHLFENDSDLKIVAILNDQAGYQQLEDRANQKITDPALKVRYSMYAKLCHGVGAVKAVRDHLDSGALAKLAATQVKRYFNPTKISEQTTQRYTCVVFAACAMSLGCNAYLNLKGYIMFFDTYHKLFSGIALPALISNETLSQVRSAVATYQGGVPHELGSKTRAEIRVQKLCWLEAANTHGMI